jgi:hypothetical protein
MQIQNPQRVHPKKEKMEPLIMNLSSYKPDESIPDGTDNWLPSLPLYPDRIKFAMGRAKLSVCDPSATPFQ